MLSPKRARFVEEYLIDLNATQAAIRAGYSPKTADVQGPRLLGKVGVKAEIDKAMAQKAKDNALTVEWVLENLRNVAERCQQKQPVMITIKGKREQVKDDEGRDVWQFDSAGANKAIELIGKHLGMFRDRMDITSNGQAIKAYMLISPDDWDDDGTDDHSDI